MKPKTLVRRYNADGTLSLLYRGRVVRKFKLGFHSDAELFAKGWFRDGPQAWGRSQFRGLS